MSTYTVQDVAAASERRARAGWVRGVVVAVFTVAAFLTLAVRVEHQDDVLRDYLREQCRARRVAVEQINGSWDALARIEATDPGSTPAMRADRLRIYRDAKLTVPVCR